MTGIILLATMAVLAFWLGYRMGREDGVGFRRVVTQHVADQLKLAAKSMKPTTKQEIQLRYLLVRLGCMLHVDSTEDVDQLTQYGEEA